MKPSMQGKFGMLEMEEAASVILDKILKNKSTCCGVRAGDFKAGHELDGFIELIYTGWLIHGIYNGQFFVTDKFLERIGFESEEQLNNAGIAKENFLSSILNVPPQ